MRWPPFLHTTFTPQSIMRTNALAINGLYADINTPPAPEGEKLHGLPPYCPQVVHKVDEYQACPSNWMHGSDKASSYFLGLEPGRHLWLDFNSNWQHAHHVAIVLSIQGINPITGQQTKELRLEQYVNNCPLHDEKFGQDRFCEKCGYKWPAQNYLTTTSTPMGQLWIDGFRAEAGVIRGFLITEEAIRGVATQLLGEDRVWAIGAAFYLSKEAKPVPQYQPAAWSGILKSASFNQLATYGNHQAKARKRGGPSGSSAGYMVGAMGMGASYSMKSGPSEHSLSCNAPRDMNEGLVSSDMMDYESDGVMMASSGEPVQEVEVSKLEIGAGAKITQELSYPDTHELSFYQDEPAGLIYINYCTPKDLQRILKAGKKDLTLKGEGFLAGLKTGN